LIEHINTKRLFHKSPDLEYSLELENSAKLKAREVYNRKCDYKYLKFDDSTSLFLFKIGEKLTEEELADNWYSYKYNFDIIHARSDYLNYIEELKHKNVGNFLRLIWKGSK